jgi:LysM domain
MNLIRHRDRNLAHGLTALGVLTALAIGVPALLIRLGRALLDSGNPFHGATPPWTWHTTDISHVFGQALDSETILTTISRLGLVLAWTALAVVLVSVVGEVHSLRRHGVPLPHRVGFGWSQAVARRLAAGLLALSTMLPAHHAAAAPLATRTVVTQTVRASAPDVSVPVVETQSVWMSHTVGKGDSLYGIAGRLAGGDPVLAREIAQQILDRNLGRTMNDGNTFNTPGIINTGWQLDTPSPTARDTYVVAEGDNYWDIARHHHDQATPPTNEEIATETEILMDANVEQLGGRSPASMLYPGDILTLPNDDLQPPLPVEPSKVEVPAAPTGAPLPTTSPATLPPPATTLPPVTTTLPTTTAVATTSTTAEASTEVSEQAVEPVDTAAPNPWRNLAIASLFATGITATIIRLRRRRLAQRKPGHRLTTATATVATTETVMRAEAKPDRITALHHLLAGLTGHSKLDGQQPLIRAVQHNDDGVELLWNEPQARPPKPWTTTDGGWSWRTPWPTNPPANVRPAPILPALVPLGKRPDGSELLLDLEAAGTLTIEGNPEDTIAFIRQLVLSLAASPLADNLDLMTIDLAIPGSEHLERIRTTTGETATEWLTARTTETAAALTKAKAPSTFAARLLGRHHDEWEPLIVATATTNNHTDQLAEVAASGSGAVIITTAPHLAAEHIILHSADSAVWVGPNVTFTPSLLPIDVAEDLAELLDHVENAEEHLVLHDASHTVEHHDDHAIDGAEFDEGYDVLVRVIGEVDVQGCNEHLTDAEIELLALLASLRPDGPINIDRLATLLAHDEWKTPKIRSIQARISHLRGKLGTANDGTPLLPDSRAATGNAGRYLLSPRVITDIDLLDRAYQLAQTLPSSEAIQILTEALNMVRGKPYTARAGHTWAYDEHAATRAEQAVCDVASSLIELLAETGNTKAARAAADRASKAFDDPAAELPFRRIEHEALKTDPTDNSDDRGATYSARLAAFIDQHDPTGEAHFEIAPVPSRR